MGCIASKRATHKPPASPVVREFRSNSEGSLHRARHWNLSRKLKLRSLISRSLTPPPLTELGQGGNSERDDVTADGIRARAPLQASLSFKIGSVKNQVTAENYSAGWLGWLSAASADGIMWLISVTCLNYSSS